MLDEARSFGLLLDASKVALVLGHGDQAMLPLTRCPASWLDDARLEAGGVYTKTPMGRDTDHMAGKLIQPRTWPPSPVIHDSALVRDGGRYAESLPADAIRLSENAGPPVSRATVPREGENRSADRLPR